MTLFSLIIKNLRGHTLRSISIFLSIMGITCFLLAITITASGTEYSMKMGIKRMGADIRRRCGSRGRLAPIIPGHAFRNAVFFSPGNVPGRL
jgi:hypothetical protein